MEKDRSARLIAIVALVLAVTGVSIGFATLSTNLTIKEPEAQVKANNDLFTVYFSALATEYKGNAQVTPELGPSTDTGFSGNQITVEENSTTLSGIGGTFTKPGQTITYRIGVSNKSKLDGYLTSIAFNDAGSSGKKVQCESVNTNSNPIEDGELSTVCDNIKVKVSVNSTDYTDSNGTINGKLIEDGSTIPLTVTITYDETATPATGDFKATFGDIVLGFKTKDNAGAGA